MAKRNESGVSPPDEKLRKKDTRAAPRRARDLRDDLVHCHRGICKPHRGSLPSTASVRRQPENTYRISMCPGNSCDLDGDIQSHSAVRIGSLDARVAIRVQIAALSHPHVTQEIPCLQPSCSSVGSPTTLW